MPKTTTALLIKFVMTFLAAAVAFALVGTVTWSWVLIVSLAGTSINFLLGDLLILPSFGNIVAAVGDGLLGAATAYVIALIIPTAVSASSLAAFGLLVAVGEYFFHKYLVRAGVVNR